MTSLLKRGLHSPSQVTLDPHVGSLSHAWLLTLQSTATGPSLLKPFPTNPFCFSVISLELWWLAALPGLPFGEWELDNWFPPFQKDATPSSPWSTSSPARSAHYSTTSLLLRDFMSEQKIHKCTPYYETVNPGRRVRGGALRGQQQVGGEKVDW